MRQFEKKQQFLQSSQDKANSFDEHLIIAYQKANTLKITSAKGLSGRVLPDEVHSWHHLRALHAQRRGLGFVKPHKFETFVKGARPPAVRDKQRLSRELGTAGRLFSTSPCCCTEAPLRPCRGHRETRAV